MSEYVISDSYETALAAFEQLEELRLGAGNLVADYLQAETAKLAHDPGIQDDLLEEGNKAVTLYKHFEGQDGIVPDLDAKRRALVMNIVGVAAVTSQYEIEGPRAERVVSAATRLGESALKGVVEPPDNLDQAGLEALVIRFINTSDVGTVIRTDDIKRIFGQHYPVERDYPQYGEAVAQILAGLSSGDKGRVLNRIDNGYMLLNKPGHPELVEAELDDALQFTQAHAQAALTAMNADLVRAGTPGVDIEILSRYTEGAEETLRANPQTVNQLRQETTAILGQMLARPWQIARAIEILPGKDPRYYLLSQLVSSEERRAEVLESLSKFVPGLGISRVRDTSGYKVTELPTEPPKTPRRRGR